MRKPDEIKRFHVTITGRVQGIGFRPFIYRLARTKKLSGWVKNTRDGVDIECEGRSSALRSFLKEIRSKAPPITQIERLKSTPIPPRGTRAFSIKKSGGGHPGQVRITPDLAICGDCRKEILTRDDRRYHYPFTNCTNCGPRLTIIKDVPYDRERTTMKSFTMCSDCRNEYENPSNRRYHAQPNACPICGPRVRLLLNETEVIGEQALVKARKLLLTGSILAVKGLGGYHLACHAMDRLTVKRLRSRKFREEKPFALMIRDIATAKRLCHISSQEAELLRDSNTPIVLLRKRAHIPIAEAVAPGNPYLGIMLPYTPLHFLLFTEDIPALVMTSGNRSQEPIVYKDGDARDQLGGIADAFLLHNREIERRIDDSVVRIARKHVQILRRSRGFAPAPIPLPRKFPQLLACGADLKNTFCLTKDRLAYVSHHLGDIENMETLSSFHQGIEDYCRLFHVTPECIVHDLNPNYLSTTCAKKLARNGPGRSPTPSIAVQHHHAHITSVMLEHHVRGRVIGIAFDGTGYGTDGTVWGGEVLVASYEKFHRAAHLKQIPLPGGDSAIKQPWKLAAVYLDRLFGNALERLNLSLITSMRQQQYQLLIEMVRKGINSPLTSSMGRLFDAVSALCGVRETVSYEGQAAIELEYLASRSRSLASYPFTLHTEKDPVEIDVDNTIEAVVRDIARGNDRATVARRFHNTISRIVMESAIWTREQFGLKRVVLSGGCFQNLILLEQCIRLLKRAGFTVLRGTLLPPNDGSISFGQIAVAESRLAAKQA